MAGGGAACLRTTTSSSLSISGLEKRGALGNSTGDRAAPSNVFSIFKRTSAHVFVQSRKRSRLHAGEGEHGGEKRLADCMRIYRRLFVSCWIRYPFEIIDRMVRMRHSSVALVNDVANTEMSTMKRKLIFTPATMNVTR